jgi:hypothetical protein
MKAKYMRVGVLVVSTIIGLWPFRFEIVVMVESVRLTRRVDSGRRRRRTRLSEEAPF